MRLTMFGIFNWLFIKPYTFYWVAGAVAVGGAVYGGISGRSARKKAARMKRQLTALNNQYIDMETEENVGKLKKTFEQVSGESKAIIGASGISKEGTNQAYLNEIESQFQGEKTWLIKSAELRKKQNALQTALGISADSAQGRSDNINAVTGLAGFFS